MTVAIAVFVVLCTNIVTLTLSIIVHKPYFFGGWLIKFTVAAKPKEIQLLAGLVKKFGLAANGGGLGVYPSGRHAERAK